MPRIDDLPPDLRATLSLLVDRGKTYAQIAELLGISESAVRDRAHTAIDMLAGAPEPAVDDRAPGRVEAPSRADRREARSLAVSRRGGALLLAAIAVVIVVVVVLVSGGGGSSNTNTGTHASTHTTTTSSKKTGSGKTPAVTNQLTLTPTESGSKAVGLAEVLAEGSQHAIIVAAEHLPPSHGFYYLVWLYNSPTSATPIGRAPTVSSNGRLQGGALLPGNAGAYSQILITRETAKNPTKPGQTVLSGKFSLGG
jgi:Anti-sigma-K factor rskA, C-terminal/Sigma-70, region 4